MRTVVQIGLYNPRVYVGKRRPRISYEGTEVTPAGVVAALNMEIVPGFLWHTRGRGAHSAERIARLENGRACASCRDSQSRAYFG